MPRSELAPGTAELIRSYLKAKGQRYGGTAAGAYRFLVAYLEYAYGGYRPPTYDSTRTMFWVMKDNNPGGRGLGLIHYIGSENVNLLPAGISRRHPPAHYNLVAAKFGSQEWRDPKLAWQAAFSPNEENRRTYARRWRDIMQLPRFELEIPIDDQKVERFVLGNRL